MNDICAMNSEHWIWINWKNIWEYTVAFVRRNVASVWLQSHICSYLNHHTKTLINPLTIFWNSGVRFVLGFSLNNLNRIRMNLIATDDDTSVIYARATWLMINQSYSSTYECTTLVNAHSNAICYRSKSEFNCDWNESWAIVIWAKKNDCKWIFQIQIEFASICGFIVLTFSKPLISKKNFETK